MELKHFSAFPFPLHFLRLNRTFYGIETAAADRRQPQKKVLIVPFMELKLGT